jgi:hypothetical protein
MDENINPTISQEAVENGTDLIARCQIVEDRKKISIKVYIYHEGSNFNPVDNFVSDRN